MTVESTGSQFLPADSSAAAGAPSSAAQPSTLACVARFIRESWLRILVISALLVVPCFWHAHLEAGDLASHTYNAWLALLIQRGQAPGLWIAGQSNNVLFDQCLTALGSLVGLRPAEKIVVSACILLFFWGAFALVCAVSRRAPWFLVPCLAMFSYGWAFQQGFMNYCLSLSLAFCGLALMAGGCGAARWLGILLLPLTWMAHPLGAVFYLAAAAYLALVRELAVWKQWCFAAVAALLPMGLSIYLGKHYPVARPGPLSVRWQFNGCDQLSLYGAKYHWVAKLFLAFTVGCLLVDVVAGWWQRHSSAGQERVLSAYQLPLQLYALSFWCVLVLPSGIFLPQYNNSIDFLNSRGTAVCAVFLCGLLAAMRLRWWHLAGFGALALAFFLFVYQDTAKVDRMETQAEGYVRQLPPGQRVLATIWTFSGWRIFIHHVVDRSCIEHCFSYANYEPSSKQFRVRANPGNGMVMADSRLVAEVEAGTYVVRSEDLPAFEIYQCDANLFDLCRRELSVGNVTGEKGPHPYSQ